jgi:hypothetical protein
VVFKEIGPRPKPTVALAVTYWLADGFHRVIAARSAGIEELLAEVRLGTQADAKWYALGANKTHGLRRTSEDKRRAVTLALEMHPEMSDRALAEHCGVSPTFVGENRRQVSTVDTSTPRVGMDGKRYPLPPPRPRMPLPPVQPPQPPQPPADPPAPPLKPGEQAIADRQTPETNTAVAAYMQAHPAVSYCQALAIVSRQPPPPRPQVLDETGREVPAEALPVWNRRQEIQDLLTALSRVRGAVRRYQDTEDVIGKETNFSSAMAHLDQAFADVETLKPYAVCPSCHGLIGCRLCGGRGVLSKFRWDTCVSDKQKQALGARDPAEVDAGEE